MASFWWPLWSLTGFDMGVGCLLPLIARNDDERRVLINSVGAHWEGNQVWLILAGGALFAACHGLCRRIFGGFNVAMIPVAVCFYSFARWPLIIAAK